MHTAMHSDEYYSGARIGRRGRAPFLFVLNHGTAGIMSLSLQDQQLPSNSQKQARQGIGVAVFIKDSCDVRAQVFI